MEGQQKNPFEFIKGIFKLIQLNRIKADLKTPSNN